MTGREVKGLEAALCWLYLGLNTLIVLLAEGLRRPRPRLYLDLGTLINLAAEVLRSWRR